MSRALELRTTDPDQTQAVAAAAAGLLRPGDVVALTGELGAGKTCFVQGAAAALGVRHRVTSPSFVLRKEYHGRLEILHIDVYRLDTLGEVVDLGWEDVVDGTRVTFIEWGDAMSPLLPPSYLEIELHHDPDAGLDARAEEEVRRIIVRPRGDEWLRRAGDLAKALEQWTVS